MGLDENYHNRQLDENALQIETPLIASLNSHIRQHFKTALYPYNASIATHSVNNNNNGGNGNHYDDDGSLINGINNFSTDHKCRYFMQKKIE